MKGFSSTDMAELHENVGFHNYYLSLIVNHAGEYCAKVAYVAKRTTTVEWKDAQDKQQTSTTEREVMAMIDMNIEWEVSEVTVTDFFRARHEKIKSEKAKKVSYSYGAYGSGGYRPNTNPSQVQGFAGRAYSWGDEDLMDDWHEYYDPRSSSKQGTIPFSTEKDITPKGTLKAGSKELRSMAEVSKEIASKVSQWLMYGITEICKGSTSDTSVSAILGYFEEFWNFADNESNYPWFVNQMQRVMPDIFDGYHPKLVSEVGTCILEGDDGDVATDLYQMLDAYEQYVSTMSHIKAGVKESVQTIIRPGDSEFDKIYKKYLNDGIQPHQATKWAKDLVNQKNKKDKKGLKKIVG